MLNQIINSIAHPILDNLLVAYPNTKNFYLKPGTYQITQTLNLNIEGVRLIGLTRNPDDVQIIQTSTTANTINISNDNIRLEYLSIHGENSQGICIYQSNCNWTNISTCHIYGNGTNHTVYFGGPNIPTDSSQPAMFDNNILNQNSSFENNIVYTLSGGNAVTINVQNNCSIRDNIIRGGPISVFLLKNSIIIDNYVIDSGKQGIFINLPVNDVNVENNTIHRSSASAIKLATPSNLPNYINNTQALTIQNNCSAYGQYIGIEINNATNINITNNRILYSTSFAMYLLNANTNNISNNLMMQFTRGIEIDANATNNTVTNNSFYSVYPLNSEHAIVLEDNSTTNTITDNYTYGKFTSDAINDMGQNNTITGTNSLQYISFTDEISKLMIW